MTIAKPACRFPQRLSRIVAAASLAFSASAMAVPTVYFGMDNSFKPNPRTNADAAHASFIAALSGYSTATESFESFATGSVPDPTAGSFANGVGVTIANSATGFLRISAGTGDLDTYSISGNFLEGQTDSGSNYFTATFDRGVHGIGFYITDASDWAGTPAGEIKVLLTTASGSVELDLTPGFDPIDLVSGNVAFFGVIDAGDPFLSIALRNESNVLPISTDGIGIDDVTIGVLAVPAPGTLPLLLGVLPGIALLRRRRSQ